jgi:hypothetical protein
LAQKTPERSEGEEPKVRAIEDSSVHVLKVTKEEHQPDRNMGDIRDRNHQFPIGSQVFIQAGKDPERIFQMLQYISVYNDIEGLAKFRHRSVEIQLKQLSACLATVVCKLSIALYTCDREPPL